MYVCECVCMLAVSDSLILGGEAVGEGRRGGRLRRRGGSKSEQIFQIPCQIPARSQPDPGQNFFIREISNEILKIFIREISNEFLKFSLEK